MTFLMKINKGGIRDLEDNSFWVLERFMDHPAYVDMISEWFSKPPKWDDRIHTPDPDHPEWKYEAHRIFVELGIKFNWFPNDGRQISPKLISEWFDSARKFRIARKLIERDIGIEFVIGLESFSWVVQDEGEQEIAEGLTSLGEIPWAVKGDPAFDAWQREKDAAEFLTGIDFPDVAGGLPAVFQKYWWVIVLALAFAWWRRRK